MDVSSHGRTPGFKPKLKGDAFKNLILEAYRIVFDWSGELSQPEVDYANALADANAALAEQEQLLAELESKDTSGMSADEATQHQTKLDRLREQRDAAQEIVDEIKNNPVTPVVEPELSPLEQLKADLTEIQEQIANMEKNGINIPVVLSEDAIALQTMVTALSTADGLSLDIQAGGVDAAKAAVEAIQTALAFIKDNPNVSSTVSASLTETGEAAITAIGILMGWDEETINMYLNPTDNVTPEVEKIEQAGGEAELDLEGNSQPVKDEIAAVESAGGSSYISIDSNAVAIGNEIDTVASKTRTAQIVVEYTEKEVTPETKGFVDNSYTNEDGQFVGYSGVLPFAQSDKASPSSMSDELKAPEQEWMDEAPGVWEDVAEVSRNKRKHLGTQRKHGRSHASGKRFLGRIRRK